MTVGRRIGRALSWPLRRVIEPRIGALHAVTVVQQREMREHVDARASELGGQLEHVDAKASEIARQLEAHREALARIEGEVAFLRRERVDEVFEETISRGGPPGTQGEADYLNWATGWQGPRAADGLWINDPIGVHYSVAEIAWAQTTERIVEIPFVLQALAHVAPPARILDIGCSESLLSLHLASVGHLVTGVDLRPYPFTHPNLRTFAGPLSEWRETWGEGLFDAAVCLSSVEHFGLAAYGSRPDGPDTDLQAMRIVREVLRPGGLLVLTLPFGELTEDDFERTYDAPALGRLLDGFGEVSVRYALRRDDRVWTLETEEPSLPVRDCAALVVARRPGEASPEH